MARLYPTLMVVLLLLNGCASSSSSRMPDDASYLMGLSSDYSTRTDQVQQEGLEKLRQELPESLIAGNEDMTVAAAMFGKDHYLTVDLVIYNHSGEAMEISRADMYVLDFMGTRLQPINDWRGAENYGLRGLVTKETEYAYLEGRSHVPGSFGQGQNSGSTSGKASDSGGSIPLYDEGSELDMLTEPVEIRHSELLAPPIMTVESGEKRAYWAYFKAAELVFPLSAVVRMDGKRLIFRFQGPVIPASD